MHASDHVCCRSDHPHSTKPYQSLLVCHQLVQQSCSVKQCETPCMHIRVCSRYVFYPDPCLPSLTHTHLVRRATGAPTDTRAGCKGVDANLYDLLTWVLGEHRPAAMVSLLFKYCPMLADTLVCNRSRYNSPVRKPPGVFVQHCATL